MTPILIRNRELDQLEIQLDRQMLDRLAAALWKRDSMGSPPSRIEIDDWGVLLIVTAKLAEPEIRSTKDWFCREALNASQAFPR